MAEEPDLRFLGEQIKRLQGDVRVLKTDVAQVRADSAKVEGDIAGIKADIARVETQLEVFREFVDDRFHRNEQLMQSQFGMLSSRIDGQGQQLKAHSEQLDTILNEIRALKRT